MIKRLWDIHVDKLNSPLYFTISAFIVALIFGLIIYISL